MQLQIALELFTQTPLIGSINRARRHLPTQKQKPTAVVEIKKTSFLRLAIQEPIFCVDRKQTTAVTTGMVLAIALKLKSMSKFSYTVAGFVKRKAETKNRDPKSHLPPSAYY
jgi:hypothetical protein